MTPATAVRSGPTPAPTTATGRVAAAPWAVVDVGLLAGTGVVGWSLIAAAWFGSSGSPALRTQLLWTNLGFGGVLVLAVGSAVWLLSGRRTVGLRRAAQLERLADALAADEAEVLDEPTVPVPAPRQPDATGLVSLGFGTYHRADCLLVGSKPVEEHLLEAHLDSGRTACRVCRP